MRTGKIFTLCLVFLIAIFLSAVQKLFSQELPWSTVEQIKGENTPQTLKNLPEWDGIYIVTKTDYIEVSTKKAWSGHPFRLRYYFSEGEVTYAPASDFVGILVKGKDYLEKLRIGHARFEENIFFKSLGVFVVISFNSVPAEYIRRKTVAPETYLLVFAKNAAELFGTVEQKKSMTIYLDVGNGRYKLWFIGLQNNESSSFGDKKNK